MLIHLLQEFTIVAPLCALLIVVIAVWPRCLRVESGAFERVFARMSHHRGARPFAVLSAPIVPALSGENTTLLWTAVAFDAADTPLEAWRQWHTVDPHVFQAFAQMTHQPINDLADLTRVVDLRHYPISDPGFIMSVKGHVGEWQSYADLSALHPTMESASNFAGSDLTIGDHALNVKTVADAASPLATHFENYPYITAVVPFDAAHIPTGALYYQPGENLDPSVLSHAHTVIVDMGLSNAEVLSHTHNAFDSVAHPAGGFHMPWFTLAVTGFCEVRLLLKGHTHLARAAFNIVGTTTSVAVSAFAGKVIGVGVGSAILPGIGTIAGAILGGICGAFSGRGIFAWYKARRLRKSFEEFEEAQRRYTATVNDVARDVAAECSRGTEQTQKQLQARIGRLEGRYESSFVEMRKPAEELNTMPLSAAYSHAAVARCVISRRLRVIGVIQSLPGLAHAFQSYVISANHWDNQVANLLERWLGSADQVAELFDIILCVPGGQRRTKRYIAAYFAVKRRMYANALSRAKEKVSDAVDYRADATQGLRALWARIDAEATRKMFDVRLQLRSKSENLWKELRRSNKGDSDAAKAIQSLATGPLPMLPP